MNLHLRPVELRDNPALQALVISVLAEFGCEGEGFACNDPEVAQMYETYQTPDAGYWVIEDVDTGSLLGGGGFSRLKGTSSEEALCELQKFYFHTPLRGLGWGSRLLEHLLTQANRVGYRQMYLESVHTMHRAIALYQKQGFTHIPGPLGATGHSNCSIFMARALGTPAQVLPAH